MQLANMYYFFRSALSAESCDRIVDMGKERLKKIDESGGSLSATTHGGNAKGQLLNDGTPSGNVPRPDEITMEELKKNTGLDGEKLEKKYYVRDSSVCWFNDQWIYDLIYPYLHKANKLAGWRWQFDHSESFQFTKYTPGGFYGWHADGNSDHLGKYRRYLAGITPHVPLQSDKIPSGFSIDSKLIGKIRKISLTLNLNKPGEYEGGNLKFDFGPHAAGERFLECEEIRPQGSIIIFPSFVYHQVTPVTKGTRYSLVLWTLGNPWV